MATTPTAGVTYTGGYGVKKPDGNYQDVTNIYGGVIGTRIAVVETNGTSAVSVFGSSGLQYGVTIVGVSLVSLDTTAGNITVENPASTVVVTIAKGGSAGTVVGGTTLSNTTVAAGTNLIVKSSSAGNARVTIQYTVA